MHLTIKNREPLWDRYSGTFQFIEEVINSCKTKEQVDCARKWGMDYCDRMLSYELNKNKWQKCAPYIRYFSRRQEIIGELCFRVRRKIIGGE